MTRASAWYKSYDAVTLSHKPVPGEPRKSVTTLSKLRSQTWPGKGPTPLGPNSNLGQRWPGNRSTWREIWPWAGPIWPHYMSSLQKADQIPGYFWPSTEYDPNGPLFRVTLTRVFLECGYIVAIMGFMREFFFFFFFLLLLLLVCVKISLLVPVSAA